MSEGETALPAAEVAALNASILARMRDRESGPLSPEALAQTPPASAAPEPEAASAAEDWTWLPVTSAARQYQDPTIKMIIALVEPLSEALNDVAEAIGKLRKENQELKLALAEMKVALVEVTAKANETSFVVQRLQIDRTGPAGPAGAMGRDGRDGKTGPAGPRGNRGQRGHSICGWIVDAENFKITPVFEDDSEGVPINLLGLFETYNAATEADDVALAVEQAAHSRAALELETERVRSGWPAK